MALRVQSFCRILPGMLLVLMLAPAALLADDKPPQTKAAKLPPPPPPPPPDDDVRPAQPNPVARPSKSPELDKDQLEGIEDFRPVLGAELSAYEGQSYRYVLLHARDVPYPALRQAARKDISFIHLWEQPKDHRGTLVHFAGRLKKLDRYDAPKLLWQDGMRYVYEGWIFPLDRDGSIITNPYCLVFTELPSGLKPGEHVDCDVSADAYFFKRYRYASKDKVTRDAPLFLGRGLTVTNMQVAADEGTSGLSKGWIAAAMVFIACLIGLLIGLNYWFRRGDKMTQSRIALARTVEFVAPMANDVPAASPEDPVSHPLNGHNGAFTTDSPASVPPSAAGPKVPDGQS
jgi:hypothetical protein